MPLTGSALANVQPLDLNNVASSHCISKHLLVLTVSVPHIAVDALGLWHVRVLDERLLPMLLQPSALTVSDYCSRSHCNGDYVLIS
jgi:hypothetical protein